ncbi:hypothetical protein [Celerinatantimonas diazotrophica]|uniref:Uncharacterized protein n=1 Tax=Celerinatantimonas diazotrophica TaxID=412034 RepID=A0A4V2PRA4_9GAMM|nr:hypothetical protein [Celerinatantimonas diazotrophica]TCK58071.1 hypothetical protein EV690_1776 [Celerinatantimonas diazotrophica]CAG9297860.1 hypothetical protein CEDIAZO_03052 [Celerinatantimonas diazotrophica]
MMKYLWLGLIFSMAAFRVMAFPAQGGCKLAQQHQITGKVGRAIHNAAQAHVVVRANMLEASLSNAVQAGVLSYQQGHKQWLEVHSVRQQALAYKQGITSHELKQFDHKLDRVTLYLCRH